MPIGPPVPANIPIVPWPEENLKTNPDHKKKTNKQIIDTKIHGMGKED